MSRLAKPLMILAGLLGGGLMMGIMYDMMLSMRAMRTAMVEMNQSMLAMRGGIAGMSEDMRAMRGDMGAMNATMAVMGKNISDIDIIAREITEIDLHVSNMYGLMAEDLDTLAKSVSLMAPSVATMGPVMHNMGVDMNRGINSFTNPMDFMNGMMR